MIMQVDGLTAVRQRTIAFLDTHPDALFRTCLEGHLTASAVVVDASCTRVLLLFHRKLQKWLQPGGHADGDANLAAVALREVREETGLPDLEVYLHPIHLDVHTVSSHEHFDLRFVVRCRQAHTPEPRGNAESLQLAWLDLEEARRRMPSAESCEMLRRGIDVARSLWLFSAHRLAP